MTVAQVFISSDSGAHWFPWDGTLQTTQADTVLSSDPGPGWRASVAVDPVKGRAIVITGLFASIAAVKKQGRMRLHLFTDNETKWSSHFIGPNPESHVHLTGLRIQLEPNTGVVFEWEDDPVKENYCTVGLTYHLVKA